MSHILIFIWNGICHKRDGNVIWKLCVQMLDGVLNIYINIANYENVQKH